MSAAFCFCIWSPSPKITVSGVRNSCVILVKKRFLICAKRLRIFLERVRSQLLDRATRAQKCGIRPANIVLDPGIGFGSSPSCDLEIVRQIRQISLMGYPVLLGPSRKSFLGRYLQRTVDERTAGTAAVICYAILNGCDIIRVHDVKFMKDIAVMSDMLRKQ